MARSWDRVWESGATTSAGAADVSASLAKRASDSICPSVKLWGRVEKASIIPTVSPCSCRGTTTMDRRPNRRQTSGSTRESVLVSSQRRVFPVRKHSPEMPESTPRRVPSAGAISPLLPRQMTAPSRCMATAAPLALVRDCAARAIAPKILSGSRGAAAARARKSDKIASGLQGATASVEPFLSGSGKPGESSAGSSGLGAGQFFTTPAIQEPGTIALLDVRGIYFGWISRLVSTQNTPDGCGKQGPLVGSSSFSAIKRTLSCQVSVGVMSPLRSHWIEIPRKTV